MIFAAIGARVLRAPPRVLLALDGPRRRGRRYDRVYERARLQRS